MAYKKLDPRKADPEAWDHFWHPWRYPPGHEASQRIPDPTRRRLTEKRVKAIRRGYEQGMGAVENESEDGAANSAATIGALAAALVASEQAAKRTTEHPMAIVGGLAVGFLGADRVAKMLPGTVLAQLGWGAAATAGTYMVTKAIAPSVARAVTIGVAGAYLHAYGHRESYRGPAR